MRISAIRALNRLCSRGYGGTVSGCMAKLYDIAILGATPAGYAAAGVLSKRKLDAVVVDAPAEPIECPLADWVPRGFLQNAGLPDTIVKQAKMTEFKRVIYHNAAMDQEVDYRARKPAGHFVEPGKLTDALKKLCNKSGIRTRGTRTYPAIHLEEDRVELRGTTTVQARILLLCQGRPRDVIAELSLPLRTVPQSELIAAGLDVPVGDVPATKELCGALHVVELPERTELGMFFVTNSTLHVRVISESMASGNRAAELSQLVADLQQAEVLPSKIPLHRAHGAVWHPPAGVALELESHVAKRCLLTGSAGGFADNISGHMLLPSVRASVLAAQTAADALGAENTQEVLMGYKTAWRKALADYLRPPNTSLQMLLPLLFVNNRIVSKFTRALLYGETI